MAQHSLLVEGILSQNAPQLAQKWRLAGLIHDAPEYVIGDMVTPFKAALGPLYRQIEARQQITNLSRCRQKKQRRPFCGGLICCLGIKVTEARTNDLTRRTASDMKREKVFLPSTE